MPLTAPNDPSSPAIGESDFIDMEALLSLSPMTRRLSGLAGPLSRILSIKHLNDLYKQGVKDWLEVGEGSFFKAALRGLGVSYKVSTEDMDRFPQTGPVLVVSNHPFGGLDGLIMGALLEEIRPDFRMLGNFMLARCEPTKPWLIPVNPYESAKNSSENAKGLRMCVQWLKEGGVLGTFPSGDVSRFNFRQRAVLDPEWHEHAISLARRCGATVVPIYTHGRNSFLFQSVGHIHPRLRTLMLPREIVNKNGTEVPISIGKPIPASQLDKLPNNQQRTRYVRMRTEFLANRKLEKETKSFVIPARKPKLAPIMEPVDPDLIAAEVAALAPEDCWARRGKFAVYNCRADEIPNGLREIGRLREVSYREEGEGSGKSCDLDHFDEIYRHIFLWDEEHKRIAGAYRIAKTDEILPKYGKEGLYTSTLFKFSEAFLEHLTPGVEVGRSFVAPDYQRSLLPLVLLLRGVIGIAGRDPKYHRMFGPVSISNTYSQASKALMTRYLNEGRDEDLYRIAAHVRPRRPFRHRRRIWGLEGKDVSSLLNGVEDVSTLVSEIEADRKGIPVLLKHYLRMHTTLMSFNVDRQFSNCLDGLIITDLKKTDPGFLNRFLTSEEIQRLVSEEA